MENRILGLKDKIDINENTEGSLDKRLKSYERNTELSDSIKRPNLKAMGTAVGEEVQAKGTYNIFHKIIKSFQNLKQVMPIQVQEATSIPKKHDQKKASLWYIIIQITSTEDKGRILQTVREKNHIRYKGKPIKITADHSIETLKARQKCSAVFPALKENNFSPRILYPAKLSFKIDCE
jgi:hypothetical protein